MFYEVTGERAIGRDGAERSHPVRIEYGDFGETSQVVRELTQVQRYQAKLRIDFTAVNESMEFTDLVAITGDGFVSSGKGSKYIQSKNSVHTPPTPLSISTP